MPFKWQGVNLLFQSTSKDCACITSQYNIPTFFFLLIWGFFLILEWVLWGDVNMWDLFFTYVSFHLYFCSQFDFFFFFYGFHSGTVWISSQTCFPFYFRWVVTQNKISLVFLVLWRHTCLCFAEFRGLLMWEFIMDV